MTTFSLTLHIPKSQIPQATLTPETIRLSHVISIVRYLQMVVDVPSTDYTIADKRGIGDALSGALESAITVASGIIDRIRGLRLFGLPLNGVCYVA